MTSNRRKVGVWKNYTAEQHAQAVKDLKVAVAYLLAAQLAHVIDPNIGRTMRGLCADRADALALGHGMSSGDWEALQEMLSAWEGYFS